MLGSPDKQLQKDRRKINPLLRQPVAHPSSISRIGLRSNDISRFELAQTVRQNVRRNSFARPLKFFEGPEATNHQIANDQKGPSVSDGLEGNANRTLRTALPLRCSGHDAEPYQTDLQSASDTPQLQSRIGDVLISRLAPAAAEVHNSLARRGAHSPEASAGPVILGGSHEAEKTGCQSARGGAGRTADTIRTIHRLRHPRAKAR